MRISDWSSDVCSSDLVVIGKALLTRPRVLLLDEPTRGVDVGAKTEQYRLIRHLADEGLGVLFATSELDELTALATRVLVMCEGKITLDLPCGAADHDSITAAANPRAKAACKNGTASRRERV